MDTSLKLWLNNSEFVTVGTTNLNKEFAKKRRNVTHAQVMKVLPDPDDILKKAGKTRAEFNGLLTDAHLWSCMQSRKSGVLSLEWRLDQDGATPEALALCYKVLDSIETNEDGGGLPEIISALLDAPFFGYGVAEVMWERDEAGDLLPYTIIPKPFEWFHFDEDGNLRFKTDSNREGELCPPRKMLLVRHQPNQLNPYGRAILSQCYWPVLYKRQLMRFGLVFAEKYGMPYLIGKYDADFTSIGEVDTMQEQLDGMIADGVITMPNSWDATILEAAKSGSIDVYTRFITMFNAEISKAVLSQTLTTEQGDTGSYAMSQTHLEVRGDVVAADTRLIERAINSLLRWVVELNFVVDVKPPLFKLYEEKDVAMERADRDVKFMQAGMLVPTEAYLIKTYGYEKGDFTMPAAPAGGAHAATETPVVTVPTPVAPKPVTAPPVSVPTAPVVASGQTVEQTRALSDAVSQGANSIPTESGQALNKLTAPLFDLIKNGSTFADTSAALATLYPELDTTALEDTIAKALFAAEVLGRAK